MAFIKYDIGDIDSNKKGSGARANAGKVSFSHVPLHLLAGVARIFMGGALKYAAYNWSKGMPYSTAYDCTMRHLFKWWYCREEIDNESGEHHLDHAICNLLMLKHYTLTYKEGDDRPNSELTRFPECLPDLNKPFDKEAYLKRNPQIKKILENDK